MKSFNKPTDSQVNAAVALLCSPNYRAYFFQRLENPNWIIPLKDRGFFADPQATEKVEGGGIRHPYWPASQYLVRMADIAPTEVADVLAGIETDNSSVLRDIVDAAIKMPAEIAVALVPTVCKAIRADVFGVIFPKATDLCVQVGQQWSRRCCDGVGRRFVWFGTATRSRHEGRPGSLFVHRGNEKGRAGVDGKSGQNNSSTACANGLARPSSKKSNYTGPGTGEDCSWSWRPAIEEHEQNRDYDFPCEMVGFVRQAFEQAIGNGQMTLENGLAIVEKQPSSVFKRLRIHLVNHFVEQAPELARSMMMDRQMLENDECKHEYAMLVGQRFSMLSQQDRDTWLGWVEAGPDMAWYDEYYKKASTNPESLTIDRQDYVCRWQFDRLHWIRAHLDGKWRDVYQEMLGKFGEPLYADLNSYHGPVRHGFDSPFTMEEMSTLPFAEALEKVDAWQPGPTESFPNGPQKEGLAGTFGQYVASKAEEFSAQAELLKGRQPIYVRTFIDKMTDAVNAGKIDIGAVLRLCVMGGRTTHWFKMPLPTKHRGIGLTGIGNIRETTFAVSCERYVDVPPRQAGNIPCSTFEKSLACCLSVSRTIQRSPILSMRPKGQIHRFTIF